MKPFIIIIVAVVLWGFLLWYGLTPRDSASKCVESVFYLEPQHAQPVPRMAPSQGTEKVAGKRPSRVLETSLIGGPWESQ